MARPAKPPQESYQRQEGSMDLNLKGKVAIVTGAGGGGIGTSVAYELASEGPLS